MLDDGSVLVQTVDLLTPIVDDPYLFGRIAAVNALSDIYAMGARPVTAMNILCFPVAGLGVEAFRKVIEGGLSAIVDAGALLVGGHSIKDEEPKYGLAVTGLASRDELTTNDALEPGHRLILTKPLGTGAVSTADKKRAASPEAVEAMVSEMTRLNDKAAAIAKENGVRAVTDVTGFGLGGHALEMARASHVSVAIWLDALPLLPGALDLAMAGFFPGGSKTNRAFYAPWTEHETGCEEALLGLVFDAQTAGGLLLGASPERAALLVDRLRASGHGAAVVGEVLGPHEEGRLHIVPNAPSDKVSPG